MEKNLALIIQLELQNIRATHQWVLQYLYYLTSANGINFAHLDRSLKAIAFDLGLTPEILSRVLAWLKRERAITHNQNVILLQGSSIPWLESSISRNIKSFS